MDRSGRYESSCRALAEPFASALETTVIHHRTWTGAGKNIPRHDAYFT